MNLPEQLGLGFSGGIEKTCLKTMLRRFADDETGTPFAVLEGFYQTTEFESMDVWQTSGGFI